MVLRPVEFIGATTTAEAVAALARHRPHAKPLAGGTDLLVELKDAAGDTKVLVDVSRIEELRRIEQTDEGLRIGSMVTHTELMASPLIQEHAPAIARAAHTIGAVQTRNMGTLGGNLVTCVPSMDSGPVLLALDARVTVAGREGNREMGLEAFFVGPRSTALEPDELLVDILIPAENLGRSVSFIKFGLRRGQALALVNVAASLIIDDASGHVEEPRIALGAVAPIVIRARKAEASIEGQPPSREAFAAAGRIATAEAKPIDDFRASAQYRRELIAILVRRALEEAWTGTPAG